MQKLLETDTEISKKKDNRNKEFQKWNFEGGDQHLSLLTNDISSKEEIQWDQFQENEKHFGIKSEFHEELYTTKINYESINEETIKKAEEIEKVRFNKFK